MKTDSGGYWKNGAFYTYDSQKIIESCVYVNINVKQLNKKSGDEFMLDDGFIDENFPEGGNRPLKSGVVNRIKELGKTVLRAATCPFEKKP